MKCGHTGGGCKTQPQSNLVVSHTGFQGCFQIVHITCCFTIYTPDTPFSWIVCKMQAYPPPCARIQLKCLQCLLTPLLLLQQQPEPGRLACAAASAATDTSCSSSAPHGTPLLAHSDCSNQGCCTPEQRASWSGSAHAPAAVQPPCGGLLLLLLNFGWAAELHCTHQLRTSMRQPAAAGSHWDSWLKQAQLRCRPQSCRSAARPAVIVSAQK